MNTATSEVTPTEVLFPAGALGATGRVQRIARDGDGRTLLVVDRTPFHPLDHTWPDQPADRGTASFAGAAHPVLDALTGAVADGSAELLIGEAIPARRGAEGWAFVVVHVLPEELAPALGEEVEFQVDEEYRAGLSAAHTACHLVSLALNKHVADLWSKDTRTDCLGNPDFDQSAIAQSRITPYASVDQYRLGKSLRKSGFGSEAFAERLAATQEAVNAQVQEWIAADGKARIDCDGPELTARRWWNCELPDGTARIACGGTHAASTGLLRSVAVELDLAPGELTVRTTVAAK